MRQSGRLLWGGSIDRVEKNGNKGSTRYTAQAIQTLVKNKDYKQAEITVTPESKRTFETFFLLSR